jgi:hypothetical protein
VGLIVNPTSTDSELNHAVDLLHGANRKTYAVSWLGSLPDRETVAKRLSPLTYVRKDLPPICSLNCAAALMMNGENSEDFRSSRIN